MSPAHVRRVARADKVSPELVAYARSLGFWYYPLRLPVDGLLYRADVGLVLVEFKSKGGKLTPLQQSLVDAGVPFTVCRTKADISNLARIGGSFNG